jgi:hypothetical protein
MENESVAPMATYRSLLIAAGIGAIVPVGIVMFAKVLDVLSTPLIWGAYFASLALMIWPQSLTYMVVSNSATWGEYIAFFLLGILINAAVYGIIWFGFSKSRKSFYVTGLLVLAYWIVVLRVSLFA